MPRWTTGKACRAGTAAARPVKTIAPVAIAANRMYAATAFRRVSTATATTAIPAKPAVTSVTIAAAHAA